MLLYLVLSSKRGKEGRERRERVRRLWAGELVDGGRYVFILPTADTEEETEDILEESEEFKDVLQTDVKLSDGHAHSKQVLLCHLKDEVIAVLTPYISHYFLQDHLQPPLLPPLLQKHPLHCLAA